MSAGNSQGRCHPCVPSKRWVCYLLQQVLFRGAMEPGKPHSCVRQNYCRFLKPMAITRRKLLQAGAIAAILSHTRALSGQPLPKLSRRVPPEYYVIFLLDGGFDSIYTTDPKLKRDVTKGCDAPFGPDKIVDAGVPL